MIITKYTLNADTDIGCPDDFLDVKNMLIMPRSLEHLLHVFNIPDGTHGSFFRKGCALRSNA